MGHVAHPAHGRESSPMLAVVLFATALCFAGLSTKPERRPPGA